MINFEIFLLLTTLFCLAAFLRQRTHFLIALLALELSVILIIAIILLTGTTSIRLECLLFVILGLSACEASLGLSLLVLTIRAHGNDLIKSMSVHTS